MLCSMDLPWLHTKCPWHCASLNYVAPRNRHTDTAHSMFHRPPMAALQVSMVSCEPKPCSTVAMPQAQRQHTWHVPQTSHAYTLRVSMVSCKPQPCSTMVVKQAQRHHPQHVPRMSMVSCKPEPSSTMAMPHAQKQHTQSVPWTSHGYSPSVHGVMQA
jgi:hypothetical protein